MKLLVIGNAEQEAECREKFGPLGHEVVSSSWPEAASVPADVLAVFDFDNDGGTASKHIPPSISVPVFVDTTRQRLASWRERYAVKSLATFGFCGLRTFLRREVLEVSLPPGGDPDAMESICRVLGTSFQLVADQAGLVTPRVICMIINEAFYTLEEGTATKEDIDLAMKLGTNYPYGPFEWAVRIGLSNIVGVLEAVYTETHDERYRICPLLIEQARLA